MKLYFSITLLAVSLLACSQKEAYDPGRYFSESEQKELLTNIVTYLDLPPNGATNTTKFDVRYRNHYSQKSTNYKLENLFVSTDSTIYYFIIRPAGLDPAYKRGVGGKFRLATRSLRPKDFEEVYNTPRLPEKDVKEKGYYIFTEMAKKGDITPLLNMRHYIEWPDSTLEYDRKTHNWVMKR